MYKLYDYDVHTLIDQSEDEADIINTISVFMEATNGVLGQRFLVVKENKETKTPDWISIKNVRDYYNYVTEYNDRLKQKTCIELKKDIVRNVKIKKKGTRK